jgi:hypothetical protein
VQADAKGRLHAASSPRASSRAVARPGGKRRDAKRSSPNAATKATLAPDSCDTKPERSERLARGVHRAKRRGRDCQEACCAPTEAETEPNTGEAQSARKRHKRAESPPRSSQQRSRAAAGSPLPEPAANVECAARVKQRLACRREAMGRERRRRAKQAAPTW